MPADDASRSNGTSDRASARLVAAVMSFGAPGFALLDGGLFPDLPGSLRERRLFARSLFLDHADAGVEKAGPWLVPLDQSADAIDRVFDLAGERARPVFWACAEGEPVLYRHVRTLNLARIPGWAAAEQSAPRADGSGEEYETVTFRHWDASVLGALLPVLDAGQFARILGPADEIALFAAEYGGLKRVLPEAGWPPPAPGMLSIRSEQIAGLIARRVAASHRRTADFLQRMASDQVSHLSEPRLLEAVARYDREVSGYGACDEISLFLWSFMRTTSPIDFARETWVRDYLENRRNGQTRKQRVEALFDHRTALLRQRYG